MKFLFYKEPDTKDCGPTCLRIVAKHYGKLIALKDIRALSETTREGSNLLKLSDAAENIGFKSIGIRFLKIYNKKRTPSIRGSRTIFFREEWTQILGILNCPRII